MAAAAPAQAAKRRVPFGFFGVNFPTELVAAPDGTVDSQMALMARSGVESVRIGFEWGALEPQQGEFDFSNSDRLIASAARHGLAVLANVVSTPRWASSQPSRLTYPFFSSYAPRSPQLFADFMTALVRRYGPRGTFWRLNPGLRRNPIRHWQIWNEQRIRTFWATEPWAPTYTRLLRAAYLAIHRADRGAKVVAGSLAAVPGSAQWDQAEALYRAGAKRYFDELSIHAFTTGVRVPVRVSIDRMVLIFKLVRDVMKRHGDGRKPLIDTELTWPAAVGSVPSGRLLGLEATPRGARLRLTAAYKYLATHMRQTRVVQAYWFIWASDFNPNNPGSNGGYDFAGLVRVSADGRFVPQPVLRTYTRVAARYEGCRKSSNARACR
jgi:polysaccharide biosynthesis protein PslG